VAGATGSFVQPRRCCKQTSGHNDDECNDNYNDYDNDDKGLLTTPLCSVHRIQVS